MICISIETENRKEGGGQYYIYICIYDIYNLNVNKKGKIYIVKMKKISFL